LAKSAEELSKYEYRGKGILEPSIDLQDYLLNLLTTSGPLTRSELVGISGIPRSTIYDALLKLMLKGLVERSPAASRGRGRPKILFSILVK
jgi:predicted transcriptional regulator